MRSFFTLSLMILSLTTSAQQSSVVRDKGWDSVNTYRIPALCTTNEGTLLAAYDCRYENSRDLQGHIDIGLSRSTDRGATWEPMRIVLDMGEWGGLPEKFNGVSDPCLLTDTKTGRVWIGALWMHGILDNKGNFIEGLNQQSKEWRHQWSGNSTQGGYSPYSTTQFIMAYSDDDGVTWSKPTNITSAKPVEWWLYAPAPGQGIVMRDGTLVMPTQGRDETGQPFSNISYSKDRGKTWVTTNPPIYQTSECAVVELSNGSLMLNIRDNRNRYEKGDKNGRSIFVTKDLGVTWSEHPTSYSALQEPVCMASLHRHGKYLLFCNPDDMFHRHNIRIKWSDDDGMTWHNGPILDRGSSFGYSCLTSVGENHIGVIWEGSKAQLEYRTIPLSEIIEYKE